MSLYRTNILTRHATDLLNITATNGYNNTVISTQIYKGYKRPDQTNSYPTICYFLGEEKTENLTEDHALKLCTVSLITLIYFEVKTGLSLTEAYEKWIEDMKRYFYGYTGFTKVFTRKPTSNSFGFQDLEIDLIYPYLDLDKENKGIILFDTKILYTEVFA